MLSIDNCRFILFPLLMLSTEDSSIILPSMLPAEESRIVPFCQLMMSIEDSRIISSSHTTY